MDNLFTVISLVIAVSGSTYAALAALRDYYGDRVKANERRSETIIKTIRECSNEATQDNGERKYEDLHWWLRVWRWSYGVPVLIFFILSCLVAGHTCFAYWSVDNTPAPMWWLYRWCIAGMVTFDVLSIVITLIAYSRINAIYRDLQGHFDAASGGSISP